ncbi:unnamed protein product [Litomosoides sigmodontis]|uniref:Uncharacterized protein n=1 Tax=Litomosoides sigmodontis TaxID=42156 RepID=A0A3P6TXA4_LITSI|nr:unnamed protein product [Litomosoides sigmodontis]
MKKGVRKGLFLEGEELDTIGKEMFSREAEANLAKSQEGAVGSGRRGHRRLLLLLTHFFCCGCCHCEICRREKSKSNINNVSSLSKPEVHELSTSFIKVAENRFNQSRK